MIFFSSRKRFFFEMMTFFYDFFQKCSKNLDKKNITKLEVSFSIVRFFRVLLGVANFASKNECPNKCSFRDMTFFFVIFF